MKDILTPSVEPERRRVPRFHLTKEQFKMLPTGKTFSIIDLSLLGLSLYVMDDEDFRYFQIASRLQGVLKLLESKFDVTLKVRSIRGKTVGLSFEDFSESQKKELGEFLDLDTIAKRLKLTPLSHDGGGNSYLWYHGGPGVDLIFLQNQSGEIETFSFYCFSAFVQWRKNEGLSTGKTLQSVDASQLQGVFRLDTVLMESDENPQAEKIQIAQKIIEKAPLTDALKVWTMQKLSEK